MLFKEENLYTDPLNRNELFIVSLLVTLKLIFMYLLVRSGFIAFSHDDFARMLSGYSWSQHPFLFRTGWPPLQFWIVGMVIKIYHNIWNANLIVNGFFSVLSMFLLYYLYRMFFKEKLALLALSIAVLFPWQLKLSLSGLTEPIYHFFLIASLVSVFLWVKTKKDRYLVYTGFSLLFGNMLRMDAWIFYIAVSIFIGLMVLYQKFENVNKKMFLIPILLPLVFVFIWIGLGKFQSNFEVIRDVYSDATQNQEPFFIRIFRYPIYTFLLSPFVAIFGSIGAINLFRNQKKLAVQYFFIPVLYFTGLVLNSILLGADTLSASLRIALPFIYLLIPVSLYHFFNAKGAVYQKFGYLFLVLLWLWNVVFSFNYNKNEYVDMARVAKEVNKASAENHMSKDTFIILERNHIPNYMGDHMVFKVFSSYPENLRIFNLQESDSSITEAIRESKNIKVGAFIAYSQSWLKELHQKYPLFTSIGPYTIFWADTTINRRKSPDLFETPEPQNSVNMTVLSDIKLIGYTLEHSDFPVGLSTFWEFENGFESPVQIEYGFHSSQDSPKIIGIDSHFVAYLDTSSLAVNLNSVKDWQHLKIPRRLPSGRYTVAFRLKKVFRDNVGKKEPYSEWINLTEIDIFNNKREFLTKLVTGKSNNYMLGLKIIKSLF